MDSYIISLTEPTKLQKELVKKGLRPHWVQAIRGSELTSQQIHAETVWPYSYIAPSVATAIGMSHIKAWKTFLDSSAPYAVILEEDAVLTEDFAPSLKKAITEVPDDYDILYLGCYGCTSSCNQWTMLMPYIKFFRTFKEINPTIISPVVAVALHGYVISRKGAERLLQLLDHRLFTHVDGCIVLMSMIHQLTAYSVSKLIVSQTSTNNQFVISTNATNQHPLLVSRLLSMIQFDSNVRLHYSFNFTIFQLGYAHINIITGFIGILGILFALCGMSVGMATMIFLLLSLPDLFLSPNWSILLHYCVWCIPAIGITLLRRLLGI